MKSINHQEFEAFQEKQDKQHDNIMALMKLIISKLGGIEDLINILYLSYKNSDYHPPSL